MVPGRQPATFEHTGDCSNAFVPSPVLESCSSEPHRIARATDNYTERLIRYLLLSASPVDEELHLMARFTRSLLFGQDCETVLCVVLLQPFGDDPRQIAVLHRAQVAGVPPTVIEVALPF